MKTKIIIFSFLFSFFVASSHAQNMGVFNNSSYGLISGVTPTWLTSPVLGSDFTLSAWVKFSDFANNHTIASWNGTTQQAFFRTEGTALLLRLWPNVIKAKTTMVANTWYHVAYVMKANVLKIYVNGVEDTNPTAVLGTNLYTSVGTTKNFSIGCTASTTTANEKHNGNMDDFTYWTVAKTDKEVSDLMNGTLVGTEANLAFLLDYENNLTDKSPVANVLVNTGITYAATTLSRTQAQNITFNALSAINTSDADVALTATASSTLAVQYTSSNTAVATIVAGKIHPVGVGTATITAYQPGDQTTSYAESTQLLTVNAVITSANAADDADVTVKVVNNKLEVTGAEAAVRAFTATGAEVDATKALKAGIYIVKVAGKTVKVSVR